MKMSKIKSNLLITFLCFLPVFCFAHPGHSESIGFANGITHPLSGLDHFLVILLVGFWSAFAFKKIWLGPISFLTGMLFGSFAGLFIATNQTLEFAISFSVLITGYLLITNRKTSDYLGQCLLALFGVFHGLAHTGYLPALNEFNSYSVAMDLIGLVTGSALLHVTGLIFARKITSSIPWVTKLSGLATFFYGTLLLSQLAIN